MKILAVNPGSTSTKIAVYEDERELFRRNVEHPTAELASFPSVIEQYPLRLARVESALAESGVSPSDLAAVVGRGGLLPPVRSGAYRVNEAMVDRLRFRPILEHASNLGAIIAFGIALPLGIPAFIYDSVAVDELDDLARVTGLAGIERKSFSHALNMRATAIRLARELGRDYDGCNLIVAHLGGGFSISVHRKGRMADIVSDDEGPFSPERSGRLPNKDLAALCYRTDRKELTRLFRGKGGLVSLLGTSDAREVEARIAAGDARAALVYEAMAYQIAKSIGELATVVRGAVDGIAITGGLAHSASLTGWIRERVEFIAPVRLFPGENELESLALGALRVMRGEEAAREYDLG